MKAKLTLILFFLINYLIHSQDLYMYGPASPNFVDVPITQRVNNTINLKVLLVNFNNVQFDPNSVSDIWNLLFSEGIYVSPNMTSPDDDAVFGSLKDYYNIISNGNLNITGEIIHNGDDYFVDLPNDKLYYNGIPNSLFPQCSTVAAAQGFDIGTFDESNKLAIIYAGNQYNYALHPHSVPDINSIFFMYFMSEKGLPQTEANVEGHGAKFSHIGIHAHEFGHLIGLSDLYHADQFNGSWDLMANGDKNGPTVGACPAPINPICREMLGWLEFNDNYTNGTPIDLNYNLRSPEIYQANLKSNGESYFCFEYREFNKNMIIGNTSCLDYNSYCPHENIPKGVLAWRREYLYSNYPNYEDYALKFGKLIIANGIDKINNVYSLKDGVLFPGSRNVRVLSPWSDPRNPDFGLFYIPNTKPFLSYGTTINVGFEITDNQDGSYKIYLYNQYPENASPTYPKDFTLIAYNGNPKLTWTVNNEPDLYRYRIYRNNMCIQYVYPPYNSYVDIDVLTDHQFEDYTYYVKAEDNIWKQSIASDQKTIKGFIKSVDDNAIAENEIADFRLYQNYPNPFNPTTKIKYNIPEPSIVQLKIYDSFGQVVNTLVNEKMERGSYEIEFDASNLASGTYFYQLIARQTKISKKMLIIK